MKLADELVKQPYLQKREEKRGNTLVFYCFLSLMAYASHKYWRTTMSIGTEKKQIKMAILWMYHRPTTLLRRW